MEKIFIGKKQDFGTKAMCDTRLAKMTSAFSEEKLSRFGLKRDAATFDDLTRGGAASLEKYRKALEGELKVNSTIPFIAAKAKAELDEALEELKAFIREVTNFMPGCGNSADMDFNAEDIRLNENGKVVFTKVGHDKLDGLLNFYLTSQKQIDVWNLATDIKEKYERLNKMVAEYSNGRVRIENLIDFNMGAVSINTGLVSIV